MSISPGFSKALKRTNEHFSLNSHSVLPAVLLHKNICRTEPCLCPKELWTHWTWSHPLWKIPLSIHKIPGSLQLSSNFGKTCGTKLFCKTISTKVSPTHIMRCLKWKKKIKKNANGQRGKNLKIENKQEQSLVNDNSKMLSTTKDKH